MSKNSSLNYHRDYSLFWAHVHENLALIGEEDGSEQLSKEWAVSPYGNGDGRRVYRETRLQFNGYELVLQPDGFYFFNDTSGG